MRHRGWRATTWALCGGIALAAALVTQEATAEAQQRLTPDWCRYGCWTRCREADGGTIEKCSKAVEYCRLYNRCPVKMRGNPYMWNKF